MIVGYDVWARSESGVPWQYCGTHTSPEHVMNCMARSRRDYPFLQVRVTRVATAMQEIAHGEQEHQS